MGAIELMTGITDIQRDQLNARINEDLIKNNQYDKYGDGEYISVDIVRRLMNDIFGYTWSWEIVEYTEFTNDNYVLVKGRLSIPGVGIKEGFGMGKLDKKDNSAALSAAASYAFKSCAKMTGIGASMDKDFDLPLYEDEAVKLVSTKKAPESPKTQLKKPPKEDPVDKEPTPSGGHKKEETTAAPEEEKDDAPVGGWTKEDKQKVVELKQAYAIETRNQMVVFAQIWNPKIKSIDDLTPKVFMDLYDYVEENTEEFEDFDPSEIE